jgi:hypothetical protein
MMLGALAHAIPDWLTVWIAVAAIAAWLVRAKRAAIALSFVLAGKWLVAPAFAPVMQSLPWWVGPLADATMMLLLMQAAIALVFGPAAAAAVIATLLLRVLDLLFLGPFRALRWLARALLM